MKGIRQAALSRKEIDRDTKQWNSMADWAMSAKPKEGENLHEFGKRMRAKIEAGRIKNVRLSLSDVVGALWLRNWEVHGDPKDEFRATIHKKPPRD